MQPLYLHLDRIGDLKRGDVLELQRRMDSNGLSAYGGMFCQDFIRHLEDLCQAGLSYHGISYLFRNFETSRAFRADLILKELNLEYVRWKNKIDEPSRFQSLFAFTDKEDALKFAQDNKAYPTIYEVEPLGRFFKADMNYSRYPNYAKQYWRGKSMCDDNDRRQIWECLLELPVKIIKPMKLIPTFAFEEE